VLREAARRDHEAELCQRIYRIAVGCGQDGGGNILTKYVNAARVGRSKPVKWTATRTLSTGAAALLTVFLFPFLFHWAVVTRADRTIPWDFVGYHLPHLAIMQDAWAAAEFPFWEMYNYCDVLLQRIRRRRHSICRDGGLLFPPPAARDC
jgi:hypothetical protein